MPRWTNNPEFLDTDVSFKVKMLSLILQEIRSRQKYFYYLYQFASEKHRLFHISPKKIRILEGGNRSGKSTAAIHEVLLILLGEHPLRKTEVPCHWWIVLSSFKKYYTMLKPKLQEEMPMHRVKKWTENSGKNLYIIEFNNGSTLTIKSAEEDVREFSSVKIHGAIIDERINREEVRLQLRMRIVDKAGDLIFTMDRLEEDEWAQDLASKPYCDKFTFSIYDNRYIPIEEIERLKIELSDIDQERLMDGKFRKKGVTVLFNEKIWNKINYDPKPFTLAEITHNNSFIQADKGKLRIFEDRREGMSYVIGVDSAGGLGQDDSVANVFDIMGNQVAVWQDNMTKVIPFSLEVESLARYYNYAMIVPENKGNGDTVIQKLIETYGNIYVETRSMYRNTIKRTDYGIKTDFSNKEDMVNKTLYDLTNNKLTIRDPVTKKQLEEFVKYDNGKLKGLKHDDLAMSVFLVDKALNAYEYIKNIDKSSQISDNVGQIAKVLTIDDLIRKHTTYNDEEDFYVY